MALIAILTKGIVEDSQKTNPGRVSSCLKQTKLAVGPKQ